MGNSKLVEVVTVVDVDIEDCVDNSLLQIWELRFGQKGIFSDIEHKILNSKFKQDFEARVWLKFCS